MMFRFLIFVFLYVFAPIITLQAAEVYSAKRVNGEIYQFKEFTTAENSLDVSFRLENDEGTKSFGLFYDYDEKKQKILDGEVKAAEVLYFPSKGKFINLSKPGIHTFTFKFDDETQKQVTVHVASSDNTAIEGMALGLKESSLIPIPVEYQLKKENFNNLKAYGFDTTRSSGSKIYRELAKSVPLIVNTDSIGTGSVLTTNGVILTNWHVIDGSSEVTVVFKPEKFQDVKTAEHFIADVVKYDVNTDLALIKLRNPPTGLQPIKIGTLDEIEVAIDVHAIGHPKGNFWTYTKGVISQLRPNFKWGAGDDITHQADIIQTQTPINPGNSGGPLFNNDGVMIGVNSFVDPNSDGLNFAVAVSTVREFFDEKERFKKAPSKKKAEEKGVKFDHDGDGFEEVTIFDDNNNGKLDRLNFDRDKDGVVDEIWLDEDENEIVELKIFFVQHEGRTVAIWYMDDNQDNIVEAKGYDFDMDGELDKVERL